MPATTISLDSQVRDRLKGYSPPGTSYSDALTRLMDLIDSDRFLASFRGSIKDRKFPWIDDADFEWD
ncbi:MAG: hypothetical protein WDA16_08950 [Candidatus Thermoplasmatota archaeon]